MQSRRLMSPKWPRASRGLWLGLAAALGLLALIPIAGFAAGSSGEDTRPEQLPASDLNIQRPAGDYVIGTQDRLRIHVFESKDLSVDEEEVDANGEIEMPLIGQITAAGLTTSALEKIISERLSDKYLQTAHVTVSVVESASQKVTVEGEVKNPGVFPIKGRTTLMQAISMAGGPTPNADWHKVYVIRVVDGVRKEASCDYKAITKGRAPDPLLQGDDTLVMNSSLGKTAWSTLMQNLPVFTLLAYLR
jgi:polysaccharide biosynthesis/export protein